MFKASIREFQSDDRGVFAVFFALLALVLIATAGAVVDFTYIQETRTRAQTALDAAALALQGRIATDTNDQLKTKAQSILTSQVGDRSATATVNTVDADTTRNTISITATVSVPTAFIRMVGITSLRANLLSEVTQGSKNVEVAVALDITGSMGGTKLTNLQTATNSLIDLVVKTTQTPTYSKMAIIPWSNSVNVGATYADNVRGPVQGPIGISNIKWTSTNAAISGISKANPAVVTTAAGHGFQNGDTVYLANISGMTEVDKKTFTVSNVTSTTFALKGINSSKYTAYKTANNDTAYRCAAAGCELLVTTTVAHNLAAGDFVYLTGISGTTSANNSDISQPWTVRSVPSTTTFVLQGSDGPNSSTYVSGGTAQCLELGCQYQRFTTNTGATRTWEISTCISDRTTNPYTEDPPSSYYLGDVYDAPANTNGVCPSAEIQPLTTSISTLKDIVSKLVAGGSTAGHLGVAWGWYMVSPNFGYLWPSASRPAAYDVTRTTKAVVLMTDGDFNTQYCNGVISADVPNRGNNSSDVINCNSPNGLSEAQFLSICANIKAQKIILYTVGFDMAGNQAATDRLTACATDAKHYFQADTGADLQTAFKQIGQSLNSLRVSK